MEHTYSNYTVQQEATCTNQGIAASTCLTCSREVTELIPALGHDWLPTSITDESWAMPDNVRCPNCRGTSFSHTRSDYEVVTGRNLFDFVGVVGNNYSLEAFGTTTVLEDGYLCTTGTSTADGWFDALRVDKNYTGYFVLPAGTYATDRNLVLWGNFLDGTFRNLYGVFTLDQDFVVMEFYVAYLGGQDVNSRVPLMLVAGDQIPTEYEPYIETEVEIIPPIYNFTCQDCSREWTAEAVYQHAYTTFTCSRCDETMIQSNEPPMEEQNWFTGFGDALKDFGSNVFKALGNGITKILSGFVDLISGLFRFLTGTVFDGVGDFFSGLSDNSITDVFQKENGDGTTTTTLPDGLATGMAQIRGMFSNLPADLKGVLTFGIALMFLLAALKMML